MAKNLDGPSLGTWLRWSIADKGLTQGAAAKELGVDASTLNRWVNGRIIPGADALPSIAVFLGADESDVANKAHQERRDRSYRISDEQRAAAVRFLRPKALYLRKPDASSTSATRRWASG